MIYQHQFFKLDTKSKTAFDENDKQLRLTGNAYRVLVFLCVNKSGTVTDIGAYLDWAKDYDENHLRQYRYKINTIIGHDIVGYQNGIYSLVGNVVEIQKTNGNERNTDLLQADDVQLGMNHKGTLMSKKSLIFRTITIVALAIVIIGGIYYFIYIPTKQKSNSNQTTSQNASKTKQENDNEIYKDFLQKEGLLSLRFDGLAIEISIDKASFNCPEQKEYDDLDNKNLTEYTVKEIERVIELYYTCGYADVLAAEFVLGEFNKDISETFTVLEIIDNPDKKALAQKVADDWREIAGLKNEEYAISRLAADNKNDLRVLALQIHQSLISGDYAASERTRFSNQINQSTQRKQEIKYKIDNILTEKNNALVQFRVGVEINNTNSSNDSSASENQEKCKRDALNYLEDEKNTSGANVTNYYILNSKYTYNTDLKACLVSFRDSYNQDNTHVTMEWIIDDITNNKRLAAYVSDLSSGTVLFGDKTDYEQKQMKYFGALLTD